MNDYLLQRHREVPGDYYHTSIEKNFFQKYWHLRRFYEVRKTLSQIKANSILDIGCHGGLFTWKIAELFPKARINGIDISPLAIKYAKTKYPSIHFKVVNAEKIPFKGESFDLVTCFEVLEHIDDPVKVILEIKRVLKPKGFFALLIPMNNLQFKIIWLLWTHFAVGKVWRHTHVQQFQDQDINCLLGKTGLRIIKKKLFLFNMLCLILAKKSHES